MRACIVQGSQQVWVAALWYWGSQLNSAKPGSVPPWWIVLILWPLAIMSLVFGYCLQWGLPDYYRQVPPAVPNFLQTLFRRKIVLWFLASEILRDYWLSGVRHCVFAFTHLILIVLIQPYGRNWAFLWSSPIPKVAILALIIVFFVIVWALLIGILTYFAKVHTWLLPVFAVGLGAPRWCQVRPVSFSLHLPLLTLCSIDVVGNVVAGFIHSMGWNSWAIPRHLPLALVGRVGFHSRRWPGYDSAAGMSTIICAINPHSNTIHPLDSISAPRVCDAFLRSVHWLYLCRGCPSHRAESCRAWQCVPRCIVLGL